MLAKHADECLEELNNARRMLCIVLLSIGGRYELPRAELRALPAARFTYALDDTRIVMEVEVAPHERDAR